MECLFLVAAKTAAALVVAIGVFVGFGPYQNDGTWNLMRNSAYSTLVDVPHAGPTHFGLRQLISEGRHDEWARDPHAWLRSASAPVLFVPGHMGTWTQVISIGDYLNRKRRVPVFSVDFHASASALHAAIVKQQAEYTASAIERIAELYMELGRSNVHITMVAHSMGGVVAQEALLVLAERRHLRVFVSSLLVLCGPILGHPLVLEPRSAQLLATSREKFFGSSRPPGLVAPWTVLIGSGETDALVPSEVVSLPRGAAGVAFAMPEVHNVHDSFSHVNVLFSRHALHSIAGLIAGAIDGRFAQAAEKLPSPLMRLLHVGEPTVVAPAPDGSKVEGEPSWLLASASRSEDEIVRFDMFSEAALTDAILRMDNSTSTPVAWSQLEPGNVYVLPGFSSRSSQGAVFNLVLFEKPRPVQHPLERSSRGNDFDERDQIRCSSLVAARVMTFSSRDGLKLWQNISAMIVQYPVKMCVFHFALQSPLPFQVVPVIVVERLDGPKATNGSAGKQRDVVGWAQWHDEPMTEYVKGSPPSLATFSVLRHPLALLWPHTLRLPAGRALISRLDLPLGHLAPFLALDISLEKGLTAPWGLGAVILAANANGKSLRMAALGADSKRPWLGWAAESDPGVFTPRVTSENVGPTHEALSSRPGLDTPLILVISDPTRPLTVHVHWNVWTTLARCFRTYLGQILAAWLGATLVASVANEASLLRSGAYFVAWGSASCLLAIALPEPSSLTSFSPGPPPVPILVWLHILGSAIAFLVSSAMRESVHCVSRMRSCCRLGIPSPYVPLPVEVVCWMVVAVAHPSGGLLALTLRLFLLRVHGVKRRTTIEAQDKAKEADLDAWVASLAAVLAPYLLCYAPSLVLTAWILLGQHREPSSAQDAQELLRSLPSSRHRVSPWFDSWLFESRPELRELILAPALGLLWPILAVSLHAATRTSCHGIIPPVPASVADVARVVCFGVAIGVVGVAGSRPERFFYVCQPALLLHALVPAASWLRAQRAHQADGVHLKSS